MRLTNIFGAIIALFIAIGLDYVLIEPFYNFIVATMNGEGQILAMIATAVVFGFITLGIPVLIAVEDEKEETG